jgi:hypothetical protein
MKRAIGFVVIGLVYVGMVLLAAGCASPNGTDGSSANASASKGKVGLVMMCPKCETVWVGDMTGQGTKVQRYTWSKAMICPDCDTMASSQITGDGNGTLHDCPTCKVVPQRLTPAAAPAHPKGTHS